MTRFLKKIESESKSWNHTLLILGSLGAWLSLLGGLNVAQRPKHNFFSSNHQGKIVP